MATSGSTVSNLQGTVSVCLQDVQGYITPAGQSVEIISGGTTSLTVTYTTDPTSDGTSDPGSPDNADDSDNSGASDSSDDADTADSNGGGKCFLSTLLLPYP